MGTSYRGGDYQDYVANKKKASPSTRKCKACGNEFSPIDARGRASSKLHCSDPACERKREALRKKRGRKRMPCDVYAVIRNREKFEKAIWSLLKPIYVNARIEATTTGKVDGFERLYPKRLQTKSKLLSSQRKYAMQRLYKVNSLPLTWIPALLEYICRRSAPAKARFWVATRKGVISDEVLRAFALDVIEYKFLDSHVVSLLRSLDVGVWVPPERSDPEMNERVVSMRPAFREARAAATDTIPAELFNEDALDSARYLVSNILKQVDKKKREKEFEHLMELLTRRTSKYRQRFY